MEWTRAPALAPCTTPACGLYSFSLYGHLKKREATKEFRIHRPHQESVPCSALLEMDPPPVLSRVSHAPPSCHGLDSADSVTPRLYPALTHSNSYEPVVSPNPYVEVLTPSTSEWNCIWRQGLKRSDSSKMRSYG